MPEENKHHQKRTKINKLEEVINEEKKKQNLKSIQCPRIKDFIIYVK